jgi:hypothetical protein
VRMGPRHPHVERVVHEQIRQQGANYALNAKDNLRCSSPRTLSAAPCYPVGWLRQGSNGEW